MLYAETDLAHFHFDPDTVEQSGGMVKVWRIIDLKQRGPEGGLSLRALDEFDCQGTRYRTLTLSVHDEHMAAGKLLHSSSYDPSAADWHYIAPETASAFLLSTFCK
jgi:hypothetical protein